MCDGHTVRIELKKLKISQTIRIYEVYVLYILL